MCEGAGSEGMEGQAFECQFASAEKAASTGLLFIARYTAFSCVCLYISCRGPGCCCCPKCQLLHPLAIKADLCYLAWSLSLSSMLE